MQKRGHSEEEVAAGGGLLHRRHLLRAGLSAGALTFAGSAGAQVREEPFLPWMRIAGEQMGGYGMPSSFEASVERYIFDLYENAPSFRNPERHLVWNTDEADRAFFAAMERSSAYQVSGRSLSIRKALPAQRLRLISLEQGEVWPERDVCELLLVLDCRSSGFQITGLDGCVGVGEMALIPDDIDLIANEHCRVLSARLDGMTAQRSPQRLRDPVIGLLLKRAWASCSTSVDIVEPTLRLVETMVARNVREHLEHLDFLQHLDPRIARTLHYVEAHIAEPLTVAELAGVAALSPSQFARVFKATTGEAVWAFVQRRRIERACDTLRHTAAPISQIAFECGFASQNHMTNLFRRQLGTTPGNFRAAQ